MCFRFLWLRVKQLSRSRNEGSDDRGRDLHEEGELRPLSDRWIAGSSTLKLFAFKLTEKNQLL